MVGGSQDCQPIWQSPPGLWLLKNKKHLPYILKPAPDLSSPAVRSGYRIQANQQDDSMRVLYYMEKELANFDPTRPGQPSGRLEKGTLLCRN